MFCLHYTIYTAASTERERNDREFIQQKHISRGYGANNWHITFEIRIMIVKTATAHELFIVPYGRKSDKLIKVIAASTFEMQIM